MLGLYPGAAFWLALSAVVYLVASMSFHAPALFADYAWLSYGRMAPVANHLLLYGFCIPAGWAAALWILARLGRTPLAQPALVILGAKAWNLGILVGTIGLLAGDASGFEHFEFPLYAGWLLLLASVLVGVSGLNTIRCRAVPELHPAQWFAGLSLLWFPWIYATAMGLLQLWPVRGMAQGAVHGWALAQLQVVLLALFGIAVGFYFFPVLKQKALPSRHLALFALITLILCGPWTGVPLQAPVPAWMTAISRVMSVCLLMPMLAVLLNLRSLCPVGSAPGMEPSRCLRFGIRAWVLWTVLVVVLNSTALWKTAALTLVQPALFQWLVQGFGTMVLLGAIYLILPRIAGASLPFPALARIHFWLASIGLVLVVVPLLVGGFQQGTRLADARIPFVDVAAGTLMPIRVASMGQLLLILGHLLLPVNVLVLVLRLVRAQIRQVIDEPGGVPAASEGPA
ncbi:MAG: cbb3-type cytochrome c oxidase subunit I [Verrucomicrobia bacterium]|nr:cbb3-type cytochrome c oxidase subunit I [Verrucomicrobiota bacterium]